MKIILLALFLISTQAQAESNELSDAHERLCYSDAKMSKVAFEAKTEGVDIKSLQNTIDKSSPKELRDRQLAIIAIGYNATSDSLAYMKAWNKCMKNNF